MPRAQIITRTSSRRARPGSLPARDYMHLTLHCVFRHMFIGKGVNTDLWDLACDIAAESIINSLNIKALYASRQEKQGWLIKKLRDELPRLTAERIYRWLIDQELPEQEIRRIRSYFYADDHRVWYNPAEEMRGGGNGERTSAPAASSSARRTCPRSLRTCRLCLSATEF